MCSTSSKSLEMDSLSMLSLSVVSYYVVRRLKHCNADKRLEIEEGFEIEEVCGYRSLTHSVIKNSLERVPIFGYR